MLIKKRKSSCKSSIFYSLFFHACLFLALSFMLLEKRLHQPLSNQPQQDTQINTQNKPEKTFLPKEEPEKNKSLQTPDPTTFVVPAPVVYYGNQAMMNLPVPIAGSSSGTSGFDQKPTVLPTPPVLKVAETQKNPSDKPFPQEETTTFDESAVIEETFSEYVPSSSFVTFKEQSPKNQGPAQKKVTLAELFKNAQSDICHIAQEGQTSATKAGTEGGDLNGSGHQVTIKEGDMKYYTLWAKFLNHLNQAARFSRRGKEHLIRQWAETGEIQYVMHCGITVDAQGKVIDIHITHSSGCKKFDDICVADIRYAVPFPPLPQSLGKKTARFEVSVYP